MYFLFRAKRYVLLIQKIMNRLLLFLSLAATLFFSCKREKPAFIGPEVVLASPNFMIETPFAFNAGSINFVTDSGWFNASFNERVSWTITIRGAQSKAEKVISGVSDSLYKGNTIWSGSQTGLNFFRAGEQVTAELNVFGAENKWQSIATITGEKINYGNNVIVWWDMVNGGQGVLAPFWYDFYDTNEKIQGFLDSARMANDPVQGPYRSIEGKDGLGPTNYFVGAFSHGELISPVGFNTSVNDVYVNFYLRRRTLTSGMGISLISILAPDTSIINHNVGKITWEGWKLVSINLADMTSDPAHPAPFNPAKIAKFQANMQITTSAGVDQTGFDIDFITITRGGPFSPAKY
jgi:hypothetical protein